MPTRYAQNTRQKRAESVMLNGQMMPLETALNSSTYRRALMALRSNVEVDMGAADAVSQLFEACKIR